jgi:two-component system, chemotaxis family, response regulator WspF
VRIGIVNDVPLAVEALRRAVLSRPEHHVIWVAEDGAEAVVSCARDTPDLILMDLVMPHMDGVEATRRIMAHTPCAILIVTVSVSGHAARVFEAMGHGAIDAIDTPALGTVNAGEGAAPLLAKLDAIAALVGAEQSAEHPAERCPEVLRSPGCSRLVAIGASAGGPAALAMVLHDLPRDFPAAIVMVQHVDAQFAAGMAAWLSQQSAIPVRLAEDGDQPTVGSVLLAGTNDHLALNAAGRLRYTREPKECVYRPSIDVLFQSVSRLWRGAAVGVLLTGMGRDGALGLKALREKGHHTIAQDEASSAVYGMPKAAAGMGAAVEIVPTSRIAQCLVDAFARSG